MNQAKKVKLISKEYAFTSIGAVTVTEAKTSVFAIVASVSQNEFYQAGQQGFKPEKRYDVRLTEYGGQDELEVSGERFTIYRTFDRDDGRVELYATKRKGQI